MKCLCCIEVVKIELEKLGLHYTAIEFGVADIKETLNTEMCYQLNSVLNKYGLELIDDHRILLTEKIKKFIIASLYENTEPSKVNLSTLLSDNFNYNYKYLSNVFTAVEGITIEKFIIEQKIQRVKELLIYEKLSLNETASKLNYSSIAYLSNQFKKMTGLTPSHFKKSFQKKLQEH